MKRFITLTLMLFSLSAFAQNTKSKIDKQIKIFTHIWEGVEEIKLNIAFPKKDSIIFYDETSEFNFPKLVEKSHDKVFENDSLRAVYLNELKMQDNEGHKRQLSFVKTADKTVNLTLIFIGGSGNNLKEALNETINLYRFPLVSDEICSATVQNQIDKETILIGKKWVIDTTTDDLFVASSYLYYRVQKISNSWVAVFTINNHYPSRQKRTKGDEKKQFDFLEQVSRYIKFETKYNGRKN